MPIKKIKLCKYCDEPMEDQKTRRRLCDACSLERDIKREENVEWIKLMRNTPRGRVKRTVPQYVEKAIILLADPDKGYKVANELAWLFPDSVKRASLTLEGAHQHMLKILRERGDLVD